MPRIASVINISIQICWLMKEHSMVSTLYAACEGKYACVRPDGDTYGIYRTTVANVDAHDTMCRWIGEIIARDLWLVASRLYRMAVTWPRVPCRRYCIPLYRHRPPGLHMAYKRDGKERKAINIHATCVLIRTPKSRCRLVPLSVIIRLDRRKGKLHLHVAAFQRWLKPVPTPFIPGRDPMK